MLIWECDGCGGVVQSDPLGHTDWGGVIRVEGPDREECGQPMDYVCEGRLSEDGRTVIEDTA